MAWLAGCRRLHRRYERKADHFLWRDFRDLLVRARVQLGGPIVLVWDNVRIHEVARKAPGAELFRSAGGHYDVYEGGAGFAEVLRTEVNFLHRHATTAAPKTS